MVPWALTCLLASCSYPHMPPSLTRCCPTCLVPSHTHREYPDFYRKLYGLLDPSVFHVKYRARFFHLADLFLSSS